MSIDLYDNDFKGTILYDKRIPSDLEPGGVAVSRKDLENITKYGNLPISDIVRQHKLYVFPPVVSKTQEELVSMPLFTVVERDNQTLCIQTNNLVGFVGVEGTEINIKSRFSKGSESGEDFFLFYLLQKVFRINSIDLKRHEKRSSVSLHLEMLIFPRLLCRALSQGLYKEYRTFHHNDNHVRGVVDINRFIRRDFPFSGKVATLTREFTTDNRITQLIRHTIEIMRQSEWGRRLLDTNTVTKNAVNMIVQATPSYTKKNRLSVIAQNDKTLCHPYFTYYKPLQELCLRILRNKCFSYGKSKNEIDGVLFDVSWLWEEYLATILCKVGFQHPQNKEGQEGIHVFMDDSRKCYPDFYNDDCVADAKYKRFIQDVDRNDLFQIISYMHIMQRDKGVLIHPRDQSNTDTKRHIAGLGGDLSIVGMNIPQNAKDFKDFQNAMNTQEETLIQQLTNRL